MHDDPILADGVVNFVGQPIFAVAAASQDAARKAARLGKIEYEPLPAILDIAAGRRQKSWVLPPMKLRHGDAAQALGQAPRRINGAIDIGGQEQFYLEGQISYIAPQEDGCFHLWCSTQHPTEMQQVVSHALGLAFNQVTVETRRMGGGFGGKESQSAIFACIAAVAASHLRRPVKLRLDRDDDMTITGKRHGFHFQYDVGYDGDGRVAAAAVDMAANAGWSADLTGPVVTRAVCHFDNAYYLENVAIDAYSVKTNTQSNTAFRGFGGPQGAFAMEYIIDNIARELGKDPSAIRKLNFYGHADGRDDGRDVTPYGEKVTDNVMHELFAELERSSDYARRRRAVDKFNKSNPVLRRGLAITPVKFGISFNLTHFNQAGALVHVYTDGSVLANHGGAEMGQGVHTKVAQVVAAELGIDVAKVRSTATHTGKVANTSATAASTGSDLNGKAAQDAASQIRERLATFAADKYGGDPYNVEFADNHVITNGKRIAFADIVKQAYENRVQLWSDGFYKTPGLHWNRETMQGHPFYYYAYGAAAAEVAIDTLTGESKLLRVDILHDAGNPMNPAIDIGQIEGAFIQGAGWLTSEELRWDDNGRLTTHAPSTYKIPTIADCPAVFNTRLFNNPKPPATIMRSKAVGEPPLLLAFSVFFAIRDAIASIAGNRVNPPLAAPATPEAILKSVDATRSQAA